MRALFAVVTLVLPAVFAPAQPAATGTVEGRVLNTRNGEYVERARVTVDGTADFASYVPRGYNWVLSLTREKFSLRANWNYRGHNRQAPVTGRSIQPSTYTWGSKQLFLDLQGEYLLRKRFAVFANLRNVGDATNDTQIFGPATPEHAQFRQRTTYGSLWSFGLKGSF